MVLSVVEAEENPYKRYLRFLKKKHNIPGAKIEVVLNGKPDVPYSLFGKICKANGTFGLRKSKRKGGRDTYIITIAVGDPEYKLKDNLKVLGHEVYHVFQHCVLGEKFDTDFDAKLEAEADAFSTKMLKEYLKEKC